MLEFIRQNAQSWIVKALFGIIVLVFVFWGVGSFRGNKKQTLAVVNDFSISSKEFFQYHKRKLDQLRQRRPEISDEQLREMDFKKSVFDQLVVKKLLFKKAKDLHMFVTSSELKRIITNMKVFQNQEKKFDMAKYRGLLKANNMVPGQFESQLQRRILRQKLRSSLISPVQPGTTETRDLFNFLREKARIEYLLYNKNNFIDQVELKEQNIQKYYQNHKQQFKQPARMQIKYLLLTPKSLARHQDVMKKEIQEYYRNNRSDFQQERQVKARHILIRVKDTAPENKVQNARKTIEHLKNRLKKGSDFAALARKESEGPTAEQGGDLGWIKKGEMMQSFEKAAFDLKPGEVSKPVRTKYGFHLIKVEDKREKGEKPLKEVRDKVRRQVAIAKASGKIEDKLDKALKILMSTGNFDKVAQNVGVNVKKSGLFSKKQGPAGLELDTEGISTLFALKSGEITEYPILFQDGYLLAKNIKTQKSYIPKLEKVKSRIKEKLRLQQAQVLAKKKAKQDLARLMEKGANALSRKIRQSQKFNRRGPIPDLVSNSALIERAFQAEDKKWFTKPYQVDSGYVLARLKEKIAPSKQAWEKQKSYFKTSLTRSKRRRLLNAYIQELRNKAQIEIQAPQVLKY